MHSFLQNLVNYNTWANNEVVESLRSCPEVPRDAVIRLSHILENNWYVLDIIDEQDLSKWDADRDYTIDECIAEIPKIDAAYKKLLGELKDEQLEYSVRFTDVAGRNVERRISELIFHTFDHCSHHRGQIAMIVREAGGEPAQTWYNRWIRETGRGKNS
ncbi:MAG: hypothetical protein KDB65_08685 [Calditrichaeota bacterium]|nr:hypothetical protein [Calditrichota bacterium]MCB9369788.1 hypothetical protein [Calditrichota bacterium]